MLGSEIKVDHSECRERGTNKNLSPRDLPSDALANELLKDSC